MINPVAVDLSHWIPAGDYHAVRASGIVGVIYKATEGQSYTDDTYVSQRQQAKAAGLLWGSYHFADASDTMGQAENFLHYAAPDPDELFCLDWEDNPTGNGRMSLEGVKEWMLEVERRLDRPGQCVLYSGNTAKEVLGSSQDVFLGMRRLWLAHYASEPVCQDSWSSPWLHQYTDGNYGPEPHSVPGIGHCDINSAPDADAIIFEWATGLREPPRPPMPSGVDILVFAPPGVLVRTRVVHPTSSGLRSNRALTEAM
jgi:lysozyme